MSGDESSRTERRLADAMAAFDDGLAAGREISTDGLGESVDPDLLPEWERLAAFLTLVEQAWPRDAAHADRRTEPAAAGPVEHPADADTGPPRCRKLPSIRPFPDPADAGARGLRDCVPRLGPGAAAGSRAQGPAARDPGHARGAEAVPPRGARRRDSGPPQHRSGVRERQRRHRRLYRIGLLPWADARGLAGAAVSAGAGTRRGESDREARPSRRTCPRARRCSPRPQAQQCICCNGLEADGDRTANQSLSGFQPRITDFSLAWLADGQGPKTRSGVPIGSPPYMAPEQAEGRLKAIGPPTDVYGLGCILYELLTVRPPFRGESQLEILKQVIADDPIPPRRLRKDIPIDVESIVLKCLEKDPARRYSTAGALADDLDRFLAGEPTKARPPGRGKRSGAWRSGTPRRV